MQIIAIDELYKQMDIDLKDVVYIDVSELCSYEGEYVILPVTMPLINYVDGGISGMFSQYIIPVFLGLTMVKDTLEENEISYLRKYEPVGCRDEKMLGVLRRYGIKSFLNGCMTITMPRYDSLNNDKKTYIVDVEKSLTPYIPVSIKQQAVCRTHFLITKNQDRKEIARKLYQEYKECAKVVITSLLHCALPCLAAGVPVILLKKSDGLSYRFSWIEKILPVYSELDLEQGIDWNPLPIDIETIKRKVFEVDTRLLRKAYSYWSEILEVSWFYENREKHLYKNDACEEILLWINTHWNDKMKSYRYAFWGLTQISEYVDDYIHSHYPNASLCHAYDTYRKLNFRGLQSIEPHGIIENIDEYVFVTALGAVEPAKSFFENIRKKEGTYAFYKTVTCHKN